MTSRVTWKHLTGFVIVTGVVFALGIARGSRQRPVGPAWTAPAPAPEEDLNASDANFVAEVPAYPGANEIPIGAHSEYRDMFGFPTAAKTFVTPDPPEKVCGFYERSFRARSLNVYPTPMANGTVIAAVDVVRRKGLLVIVIPEAKDQTRVIPVYTDYKGPHHKGQPRMLPLDLGPERPMMLTGDGRSREMAVYALDGSPADVYRRYGGQLEAQGWKSVEPTGPMASQAARTGLSQRLYVHGANEILLTARQEGGQKTVLLCMMYPRMG